MQNNFRLPKAPEIKFFQSAEYQRKIESAKHRMRSKPFVERFKTINIISIIGTFFFPTISVLTAIAFLYNYINVAIDYSYLSIFIAIVILTLLELIKKNLLNNGLDTYFSNSGKSTLVFLFALLFSVGSFIMSYQGAELIVKNLDKSKQQIVENTNDNISEIKLKFENEIDLEKGKIIDLKNKAKKQWRGLNTPEQNKLILVYEQNIKQYRNQGQKDIDLILMDKKENISEAEISGNYNAYVFKIFAAINEFLTILSIVFVAFYAFKTVRQNIDLIDFNENPNKYSVLPSTKEFATNEIEKSLPNHNLNSSSNRNVVHGFLQQNNKIEKEHGDRLTMEIKNKRICKYCGNEFNYKHWNKQYCSDACRIGHWEQKTGKKLKLKKAK